MLFISILDPGRWALLSWATAVYQWRKHIIGIRYDTIHVYFWYYFKSHRQYPNTSTSHCYGKDDESNILPFFSVDVKPHDLPKIFSPGKPPIAAAPREKMRVPLHCSESDTDPHLTAKNWLISPGSLISTALSWLETERNLYTTLVEVQQKWLL